MHSPRSLIPTTGVPPEGPTTGVPPEAPATSEALACWVVAPGQAELRAEALPPLGDGQVRVRTLHSAVSRGTEALVLRGEVPVSEHIRMRAPFQVATFRRR